MNKTITYSHSSAKLTREMETVLGARTAAGLLMKSLWRTRASAPMPDRISPANSRQAALTRANGGDLSFTATSP